VLDTGTTLMITEATLNTAIANAVQKDAGYQAVFGNVDPTGGGQNCLTPTGSFTRAQIDQMLPPFKYTISGQQMSAPATASYLLEQQGAYCWAIDGVAGISSMVGADMLLGDAFLRNFVVNFDFTNEQVGFAPQKGCAVPPEVVVKPVGPVTMPTWRNPRLPRR
jgi:hypothetical protein